MQTLPAGLVLNDEQKMLVEQHISALDSALAMTPYEGAEYGQQTMVTVSKMMVVLPSREAGDLAAEAKGEAYMAALEDIPSWAVQEAMRRWYRGECGANHDYKWQPGPSTLREISMPVVWGVKATQRKLRELVAAVPLIEYSEEHCAAMRAKIRQLGLA